MDEAATRLDYRDRVDGAATRGVYGADRASALAGVPESTVYYWARRGVFVPSVSHEKLKLWSWADLVALRAIYWLRHPGPDTFRRPTSMPQVRTLVREIESRFGRLGENISAEQVRLSADHAGRPHLSFGKVLLLGGSLTQTVSLPLVIDLLAPFSAEHALLGPDLVRPRPHLRIIPGKLAGEPHVEDTRLETRVLFALHRRGFSAKELTELYPGLSLAATKDAISLERQLAPTALAA